MTWATAVPAAVVVAAWCVAPGAIVARAAGWRGVGCWGAAPLVSVALIATTAIIAGRAGVGWGPWPVLTVTVVLATLTIAVRRIVRRRPRYRPWPHELPRDAAAVRRGWMRQHASDRQGPDGPGGGLALAIGTAVAIGIGWLTVVRGFGPVDAISATYDGMHHYSAVARILSTGDASSLTLGELTNPGSPRTYPAAWHDLVSLVVLTSGVTVPVASNLVALSVAALVWPLSCVLLVRQIVGRRPGALLVTPVLATAFSAMPWTLMTWGVLWPNLLGMALVPSALGVGLTLLGLARDSVADRGGALALGVVAVPALGLAHPNAIISLLVVALSPIIVGATVAAVRRSRERRYLLATAGVLGALAAVLVTVWFLAWSPYLASLRKHDWPVSMGAAEALRGVALNGTDKSPALVAISVLVVVGAAVALHRARTAWLVPAHLTSAFLYVLAVAREGTLTTALTAAWYNDSHRLAAMLPVTGVPLAALGLLGIAGLFVRVAARLRHVDLTPERRRRLVTPVVAIVALCLVAVSGGLRIGVHSFVVAQTYQREATWMLQPGQRQFLEEVAQVVPVGDVVAADPWTGNALLYPLTGRDVMFPHMSGNWTPAQQTIRLRLRDAGTDPAICDAVRTTGLEYAISGPVSYWPWHPLSRGYPGLADLGRVPGFEPILSGGGSTLYRVAACDSVPVRTVS